MTARNYDFDKFQDFVLKCLPNLVWITASSRNGSLCQAATGNFHIIRGTHLYLSFCFLPFSVNKNFRILLLQLPSSHDFLDPLLVLATGPARIPFLVSDFSWSLKIQTHLPVPMIHEPRPVVKPICNFSFFLYQGFLLVEHSNNNFWLGHFPVN